MSVCLFKLKDINCYNSFIWRFDFSISHGQIIYRLVKSIFFSITLSLSRFPSGGLYTTSQFLKLQQTKSIFMISIHLKHLAIFRNFFSTIIGPWPQIIHPQYSILKKTHFQVSLKASIPWMGAHGVWSYLSLSFDQYTWEFVL